MSMSAAGAVTAISPPHRVRAAARVGGAVIAGLSGRLPRVPARPAMPVRQGGDSGEVQRVSRWRPPPWPRRRSYHDVPFPIRSTGAAREAEPARTAVRERDLVD